MVKSTPPTTPLTKSEQNTLTGVKSPLPYCSKVNALGVEGFFGLIMRESRGVGVYVS